MITNNHQTNDKARVPAAAAAAAPQTRTSNAVIAPDVDCVGLAEVDKDVTGLAPLTSVVGPGVATLPVAVPVVLLVTTANVLEFDAMDDDMEMEEAKAGGGTTSAGLTSAPVPQGMLEPSG